MNLLLPILMPVSMCALLFILPTFRRPAVFFGIRTMPGWSTSPEAEALVRTYRIRIAVMALIWLALGASLSHLPHPPLFAFFVAAPLLFTAGAIMAMLSGMKVVRAHTNTAPVVRRVSLDPTDDVRYSPVMAFAGPLVILAAAAAWLWFAWDRIPSTFPVHWDFDGRPNRWSSRTFTGVYGPILIGIISTVFMGFLGIGIREGAPRSSGSGGAYRRQNIRLLIAMSYLIATVFACISLYTTGFIRFPLWMIPLVTIGLIAAFLVPMIRAGREDTGEDAASPESAWFLGILYYNPADPSLMVPKRFGIGYTLNFANRLSWFFAVLTIALPVIAIFIARH